MRICIDLDGIVVDLLGKWLDVYNSEWKDNISSQDIKDWDVHKFVHPDLGIGMCSIITRPGFFDDLRPIPGVVNAVRRLKASGYDVVFATAAASSDSARAKIDWVQSYLDCPRQDVIICHRKDLIIADVLIDDSPRNLTAWVTMPEVTKRRAMTIAYPYNECVRDLCDVYAENHNNTEAAWEALIANLI